jgi:hypothetical protein
MNFYRRYNIEYPCHEFRKPHSYQHREFGHLAANLVT